MQCQSLCIVLLIVAGVYFRRRRQLHVKIMSAAIIWDIFLILQIELGRGAVLKASNALSNPAALNIHVACAVITVVLYAFMIQSGRKILNGNNNVRPRHRFLGWTTLFMRVLTFTTSFWAVVPRE